MSSSSNSIIYIDDEKEEKSSLEEAIMVKTTLKNNLILYLCDCCLRGDFINFKNNFDRDTWTEKELYNICGLAWSFDIVKFILKRYNLTNDLLTSIYLNAFIKEDIETVGFLRGSGLLPNDIRYAYVLQSNLPAISFMTELKEYTYYYFIPQKFLGPTKIIFCLVDKKLLELLNIKVPLFNSEMVFYFI